MKSTGSVVTYLIFEFLIPACYVWKYTVIFSWILNIEPHSCIGAPAKYNYEVPGGGWGLSRGLSVSGAPGEGPGGLQLSSAGTDFAQNSSTNANKIILLLSHSFIRRNW